MDTYRTALTWALRMTGIIVLLISAPTLIAALSGSWSPYEGADFDGIALALMNLWVGPLLLLGLAEAISLLQALKR